MDTALNKKFPFILDSNLAKAKCTENRVCTSCDTVVLGSSQKLRKKVHYQHKLCSKIKWYTTNIFRPFPNGKQKVGSRQCKFSPWDKGQCPHGTGCSKCFQHYLIAPKCPKSRSPSYPILLEALATPWDSVEKCSMGTLSLVPRIKVASSGPTFTVVCCRKYSSVGLWQWIYLFQYVDFFT